MKPLYWIVLSILFSSCTTTQYFYSTVSSSDPYIQKNDKGLFSINGDSIGVHYSFSGENAPIKITIHNKMHQILYADWENSWLVVNNSDRRIVYADYLDPAMSLFVIYPNTKREITLFQMEDFRFDQIKKKQYYKTKIGNKERGALSLKAIDFNDRNSPLCLSSHLTLYERKMGSNPYIFEDEFYVSNIMTANNLKPIKVEAVTDKRNDLFYVKKTKEKNKVGKIIFGEVMQAIVETALEHVFPTE